MAAGQYLAFLGVSLLVICTPGQDTALTVRNTLAGGRRGGVATAIGVSSGQALWTVAASAGLTVLLMASAPLFAAVRLAGAAYLVYVGGRSLLSAFARNHAAAAPAQAPASRLSIMRAFGQGLLSDLSNAKMVAFFVGFLPAFAGAHPHVLTLLALGLNFSILTLAWLTGYAYAVERAGRWLRLPRVRRALDAAVGAVLVGFGLRVAAEV